MNQLQLKMKQQIQKQNKGEWTMNREALLIVSNGQQCHKNHLSPEKSRDNWEYNRTRNHLS